MLVAFEVQHDIDQVLERPRPGDRAVLRDVPDQQHRNAAGLGERGQALVTARTWVTPPETPSTSAASIVCTESTTSSVGLTCST